LDSEASTDAFSQYLFSFVEKVDFRSEKKRTFGVCFVDTTVGKISIGQFEDDRNCSKFRTTLAQFPPAHILYEKGKISKETKNIIDFQAGLKDPLFSEKEMFSAGTLLRTLTESDYFKDKKGNFEWPEEFKRFLSENDSLGLTANSDYEYALSAFGGILYYLQKCLIDTEVMTMKNFELYKPVDNIVTNSLKEPSQIKKTFIKQKYMVLDSISLANLEIIENNYDGSQSGTLFEQVDSCNTHFGKRLLKHWLVNPLCDPTAINDRLDAIDDLRNIEYAKFASINEALKSLPDLERLINKVHHIGNLSKNHPDSRAIMYENDSYGKRKIEDFICLLNGFTTAADLLNNLKEVCTDFKSKLLKSILVVIKGAETNHIGFPYLKDLLNFYKVNFDAEEAKREGKIIPRPGINPDFDEAIKDLEENKQKFQSYLNKQSKELKCTIKYFGTNKNRYQLEIPEERAKNLKQDYELTSSKKGFKRYWTQEIKEYLAELTEAEARRDQALRDTIRALFKKFDNDFIIWNRAVQCLTILDVLLSMTSYVRNSEFDVCRPEILFSSDELDSAQDMNSFIEIKNGRHPCLQKTFSGDYIPNDVVIGSHNSEHKWQRKPLIIVTGPNMGGKSTLMRQTGLTVILAQMGSFVPASSCRLTPIDRIFTRIGANDKILHGESTFYVELSETASILRHASRHSLVLMDELGRGTATFDGTAIAYSVVKELAQKIKCLTLFSTHYHHLVEEFSDKDNVSMGHMQSMVNDGDQSITFLYKFGEGACPKSHGFNAARLADVPEEIIKLGLVKSAEFENFTKRIQLLKKLLLLKKKTDVQEIVNKFKALTHS
jgi:DNA mismatch repair protein MSH6